MSDCAAAVIYKRSGADYPKMPLEDSAKKWQNSCVRNLGADRINLPPFVDALSRAKQNWGYYPRHLSQEVLNLCQRVRDEGAGGAH